MTKRIRVWGGVFSLWLGLISGCASVPTEKTLSDESALLYDGEAQVLYEAKQKAKTAQEAMDFGEQALEIGDTDRALYQFVTAYELDSSHYMALYNVGMIHANKGSIDRAALAFNLVLKTNPDHAETLMEQGLIKLRLRRQAQAEEHLKRAVELNAGLWRALNGLAVLADIKQDFASAESYYLKALALNQQSAVIWNNRGYSRYLAGDWTAAQEYIRTALDLDAGYKKAWLNLGLILVRDSSYDKALSAFERVMDRTNAYERVGSLVMMEGKHDVAEYFLNLAIDESTTYYKEAYDKLEQLRALRGQGSEHGLAQMASQENNASWEVFELNPLYVRPRD